MTASTLGPFIGRRRRLRWPGSARRRRAARAPTPRRRRPFPLLLRRGLELDDPVLVVARTHREADGHAHEIGVFELDARVLVSIVEQRFEARVRERDTESLHRLGDALGIRAQDDDVDRIGRDRDGPDDAVVVMGVLDDRRHDASQPDSVAAHDHGQAVALRVQVHGVHGLGVLRAELEDVPHLDGAVGPERRAALRAGVSLLGRRDVGDVGVS